MSTLDTVFLIITACALSLYFLLSSFLLVLGIKLVKQVRHAVAAAESAIESVESASETLKNIGAEASGPLAVLKVVRNIMKLVNRK